MPHTNLTKSIDEMIDDLFAEKVVKSEMPSNLDVASQAKTTADAVVNSAPKGQSDDSRGAGRPKQISDVPDTDEDGKRAGSYDGDITEQKKPEDQPEASQVKMGGQDKGSQKTEKPEGAPFSKSVDQAEWEEFQTFKEEKRQRKEEKKLKKAQEEQADLIKSVVKKATASFAKENEDLKKSLAETQELVKAMAERPQRRKSVEGIQALEKSQSEEPKGPQSFSKSEMLDVAEELVAKSLANKDMAFRDDHLIELENTGFIFDQRARKMLEDACSKKK